MAKYLAENDVPVSIEQLHLVAGCFNCGNEFDFPRSLKNTDLQCKNIYIYHSTDDPIVDFEDAQKYKNVLPNAQLVQFDDRLHFIQDEFPEIIANIKK